jgi:hypothetical protein
MVSEIVSRIASALDTAESIGYISKYDSLASLLDMRYEILLFAFDEDEVDELSEQEIETAFNEWRK